MPSWSPDGLTVLYDHDEGTCHDATDLWTVNPDGTAKGPFYPTADQDNDGLYQAYSHWGSHGRILFSEMVSLNNWVLAVIDDDATGHYQIPIPDVEANSIRGDCWAFGNKKIIYSARMPGEATQLWLINDDGTDPIQITYGPSDSSDADFIPALPCLGDFDGDGDVDGSDLAALIDDPALLDLASFAAEFGRTDCLVVP